MIISAEEILQATHVYLIALIVVVFGFLVFTGIFYYLLIKLRDKANIDQGKTPGQSQNKDN